MTQENLWVYETLLNVIAQTNEERGATRPDNAAIRVIVALEVGREAGLQKSPARILSPRSASQEGEGGMGGEGGMEGGYGGEGGMVRGVATAGKAVWRGMGYGGEGGMEGGYGREGGDGDAMLLPDVTSTPKAIRWMVKWKRWQGNRIAACRYAWFC